MRHPSRSNHPTCRARSGFLVPGALYSTPPTGRGVPVGTLAILILLTALVSGAARASPSASPSGGPGTVLRGFVLDSETSSPLPHVVINIRGPSDSLAASAVSDDGGRFSVTLPSPGAYTVTAHLIGHAEYRETVRVGGPETAIRIRLIPEPIPLAGVEVRGGRPGASLEWSAPSFVRVIDRAEIVDRGGRSIEEVLDETAGVQTTSYGGLGAFSTVSIRGSTAEQVAIYVDGIPWNESRGGGVNLSEIPLGNVERIEIYRGSAPMHFGGQAMGGVINIITRPGGGLTEGAASLSRGSFGTSDGLLRGAASVGGYHIDGSFSYRGSGNDFEFLDDNGTSFNLDDDAVARRRNNGFVSRALILGVRREAERLEGDIRVNLTSIRQGLPGISNNEALGTSLRTEGRSVSFGLTARKPILGVLSPQVLTAYRESRSRYRDPEGEIGLGKQDNDDRTVLAGGEAGLSIEGPLRVGSRLTAGAWRESFKPRNRLQSQAHVRESIRVRQLLGWDARRAWLGDRVAIQAGAVRELVDDRFNAPNPLNPNLPGRQSETFTAENAWHVGAKLSPAPWLTVKTNRAVYFRPPSFYELFGDRGPVTGNADLKPESGSNVDIGLRLAFESGGRIAGYVELSGFRHVSRDLILYIQNAQQVSRAMNIGRAEVTGIELAGEVSIGRRWLTRIEITSQDPRDRSEVDYWRDKLLPNSPRFKGWVRNRVRLGRAEVHHDFLLERGQYLDRANIRPIEPKEIHNVGLSVRMGRGYEASLEVKNLTDRRIPDHWGYPLPGRAFFAGVRYRSRGD